MTDEEKAELNGMLRRLPTETLDRFIELGEDLLSDRPKAHQMLVDAGLLGLPELETP
jgi:hypothetical protein